MKHGDYYGTERNTIVGIASKPVRMDGFSPLVCHKDKQEVIAGLLRECYFSDPLYMRHKLKDTFRQFIRIDVSMDENRNRFAEFRLEDGTPLKGCSLHPHDDVSIESLYRLFGDELEEMLMHDTLSAEIFDELASIVNMDDIVPTSIVQKDGLYYGTCVRPVFLLEDGSFTENGKEYYQTQEPKDYLYRFERAMDTGLSYGFSEYSNRGDPIRSQAGFYGEDTQRNGMEHALDSKLNYKGEYPSVADCIAAQDEPEK